MIKLQSKINILYWWMLSENVYKNMKLNYFFSQRNCPCNAIFNYCLSLNFLSGDDIKSILLYYNSKQYSWEEHWWCFFGESWGGAVDLFLEYDGWRRFFCLEHIWTVDAFLTGWSRRFWLLPDIMNLFDIKSSLYFVSYFERLQKWPQKIISSL